MPEHVRTRPTGGERTCRPVHPLDALRPMPTPPLTEEQASFIAGLPCAFSDLDYAVRSHEFTQRVARPSLEFAAEAVRIGAQLNLVECDCNGKARLAAELRGERNALTESEGYAEVAEFELAQLILRRLAADPT
ncbi:MAG: hypothetical protein ACI92S_002137 [Planctomycetaceae bacterium]|jgi:hypothetical protein